MAKSKLKPVKWGDISRIHEENLRRTLVASFGRFDVENGVRKDVLEAIRICDKQKLETIRVPGYTVQQIRRKLQEHGTYQYAENAIEERRTVIENQLYRVVPQSELPTVKSEVFEALRAGKVELDSTKVSISARSGIRESGLSDYIGLK